MSLQPIHWYRRYGVPKFLPSTIRPTPLGRWVVVRFNDETPWKKDVGLYSNPGKDREVNFSSKNEKRWWRITFLQSFWGVVRWRLVEETVGFDGNIISYHHQLHQEFDICGWNWNNWQVMMQHDATRVSHQRNHGDVTPHDVTQHLGINLY